VFNLFRKKSAKPPVPPEVPLPPVVVAIERPSFAATREIEEWNASIERIKRQFERVLVQALERSGPLVAAIETDLSPIEQVWGPLERELDNVQRSLSKAWKRPYVVLSKDPTVGEPRLAIQENKLYLESNELELAFQAAYRQVKAQAAQAMMQFALHRDARTRYCSACGSGLTTVLIGQAQNIECPYCGVMQMVEPGQAFRVFAAAAARWVGEWDAFPYYQIMKRAEVRIGRYRSSKDVPMDLLHEFHDAAQSHWRTALGVEAHLVPHMASHVARTVDARMIGARRLLRQHWQWRAFEEG